jgi:hypothetical protein
MASDALRSSLKLISGGRHSIDLLEAVTGEPGLTRSIDGASTITVPIADHRRSLLRYDRIDERSWVVVDGIHFEYVQLSKSGDTLTLTFEDAIAAALRRQKSRLSIPRGTVTRAQFIERLAREPRAHIPVDVDPSRRGKVQRVLQRSVGGETSDSWTVSGEVAEEVRWRRFSTGKRLVVGGDEWLRTRVKPVVLRENAGPVVSPIDFDMDVGKRVSTASMVVDASLFGLPPGSPVFLEQMGPASGTWLVNEISRGLTSTRATVQLERSRLVLKEPKREKEIGDPGDPDGVPGQHGGDSGGKAGNAARERMVQYALAQRGDRYVWGGNGPGVWDCSGLVQAATRAAGHELRKPSASQWGTCRAAGKTISVASALKIRGALLFRMGGAYNHVAISLGNGSTMEARGTAYGVNVFGNAASGGWTGAALWL